MVVGTENSRSGQGEQRDEAGVPPGSQQRAWGGAGPTQSEIRSPQIAISRWAGSWATTRRLAAAAYCRVIQQMI